MKSEKEHRDNEYTVAFYNLENLFDTQDDPRTRDDDFTPEAPKKWTEKRYRKKLKKLGRVISNIGYEEVGFPPILVGVAEVENAQVLEDLCDSKFLDKKDYEYVHFDSPDERGIDTALLYREDYFEVLEAQVHPVYLTDDDGDRDFTRDILHVYGKLEDHTVHVLVNHWPSRRKGADETAHKRMTASERNQEVIAGIVADDPDARIIVMGDFNDDPHSKSVEALTDNGLYNPMDMLLTRYQGSLNHKGAWNLFDQIIISHNFLQQHSNNFRFQTAKIFNPLDLQEYKGRFKGNPFRTFVGKKYKGGFSDHFPVYSIFTVK